MKSRRLSKSEVDFIKNLQNSHIRAQIISNPTKNDIRIIRNLCSNVCKGNFKFNKVQRQKLVPHTKIIRTLGDPANKSVKKTIMHSGQALGVLAPLLTALITLVAKKLLKKVAPV
jgi:hypothetical protein